jgi:hypothetical protein
MTSRRSPGTTRAPAAPAGPPALPDAEAAEEELAALVAPVAKGRREVVAAVRLISAAGMTVEGALLVLATRPGLAGHVIAAACALDIAGRQVFNLVKARRYRRQSGWTAAAAVHAATLPGRIPAPTLDAADRYLPVIANASRRNGRAWLYVAPCPSDGPCTVLCRSAASWPRGPVLVILGQHPAELPEVAAAALAHEAAHHAGPARRLLVTTRHLRETGAWGYAAAGLAGRLVAGWPGVIAAALAFHVLSLLALWAAETRCDVAAARAEGLPAALAGFADMTSRQNPLRATTPARRTAAAILNWAAGPLHPPVPLRRALTRHKAGQDGLAAARATPDDSSHDTSH